LIRASCRELVDRQIEGRVPNADYPAPRWFRCDQARAMNGFRTARPLRTQEMHPVWIASEVRRRGQGRLGVCRPNDGSNNFSKAAIISGAADA